MVDKVQMIGTAFLPMDRVNKKILVSKRSMNKKYFPGFWEVLGGNLESQPSNNSVGLFELKSYKTVFPEADKNLSLEETISFAIKYLS